LLSIWDGQDYLCVFEYWENGDRRKKEQEKLLRTRS
jgi:hypothetical protein